MTDFIHLYPGMSWYVLRPSAVLPCLELVQRCLKAITLDNDVQCNKDSNMRTERNAQPILIWRTTIASNRFQDQFDSKLPTSNLSVAQDGPCKTVSPIFPGTVAILFSFDTKWPSFIQSSITLFARTCSTAQETHKSWAHLAAVAKRAQLARTFCSTEIKTWTKFNASFTILRTQLKTK